MPVASSLQIAASAARYEAAAAYALLFDMRTKDTYNRQADLVKRLTAHAVELCSQAESARDSAIK